MSLAFRLRHLPSHPAGRPNGNLNPQELYQSLVSQVDSVTGSNIVVPHEPGDLAADISDPTRTCAPDITEPVKRKADGLSDTGYVDLYERGRVAPDCGERIAIVRDRDRFLALKKDWDELFSRAAAPHHVFQQFNWLWHCLDIYEADAADLCVVIAYRGDRMVLAWPLRLHRMFGLRQVGWFGEPVGQYGDALVDAVEDAPDLLERCWEVLVSEIRPDAICLRRVRADANVWPFLKRIGAERIEQHEAPWLNIPSAGTFETFYTGATSKRLRKQRARKLQRLGDIAPVSMQRVDDARQAGDVARQAINMKRLWLQDKSLASKTLADDRALAFFAAVAQSQSRSVGCRVYAMRVGETLVGAQVGFVCKGRLLLHMIVYDTKHHKNSPGALHMADTVASAFREGLNGVDYLAPSAPYKSEWSNDATGVCDFGISCTMKGRLMVDLVSRRLRPLVKDAIIPRIPRALRVLVAA